MAIFNKVFFFCWFFILNFFISWKGVFFIFFLLDEPFARPRLLRRRSGLRWNSPPTERPALEPPVLAQNTPESQTCKPRPQFNKRHTGRKEKTKFEATHPPYRNPPEPHPRGACFSGLGRHLHHFCIFFVVCALLPFFLVIFPIVLSFFCGFLNFMQCVLHFLCIIEFVLQLLLSVQLFFVFFRFSSLGGEGGSGQTQTPNQFWGSGAKGNFPFPPLRTSVGGSMSLQSQVHEKFFETNTHARTHTHTGLPHKQVTSNRQVTEKWSETRDTLMIWEKHLLRENPWEHVGRCRLGQQNFALWPQFDSIRTTGFQQVLFLSFAKFPRLTMKATEGIRQLMCPRDVFANCRRVAFSKEKREHEKTKKREGKESRTCARKQPGRKQQGEDRISSCVRLKNAREEKLCVRKREKKEENVNISGRSRVKVKEMREIYKERKEGKSAGRWLKKLLKKKARKEQRQQNKGRSCFVCLSKEIHRWCTENHQCECKQWVFVAVQQSGRS